MEKFKKIAIIVVSALVVFGLSAAALALPDEAASKAERRKLAQVPDLTAEGVFSGDYMEELEEYLLDQFPLRDPLRTLKALTRFRVLGQKDNNGVYLVDDGVYKMEYPLKEDQVLFAAGKINSTAETYLQGSNIFYSIVPDKNYFVAAENGYPHLDYDKMLSIMTENVTGAQYLDIFPLLDVSDYYRTDTHWKQESILDVAQLLADGMGLGASLSPEGGYTSHKLEPFYGVYWGQSALPVDPDTLSYLTSAATDAASMTSAEFEGESPVYTVDRFEGMDGYDVFCAGAQAILTLESPNAKTDKELIIFRDSYGSAIAPLFLEGYSKVTLIDLRYVNSTLLPDYVNFSGQDVLFLYSTSLLNSGMLLK